MAKAKLPRKTNRTPHQGRSASGPQAALPHAPTEACLKAFAEIAAKPIGLGDRGMGIGKPLGEAMRDAIADNDAQTATHVGIVAGMRLADHYWNSHWVQEAVKFWALIKAGKSRHNEKRASEADQRKAQVLALFAEKTKAGRPVKLTKAGNPAKVTLTEVYEEIAVEVGLGKQGARTVANIIRAERPKPRGRRGNG